MNIFLDRLRNGSETIKDPLYENTFSYGEITIDQEKCTNCGACIDSCIVGAITETKGVVNTFAPLENIGLNVTVDLDATETVNGSIDRITIDNKKCIYCRNCIDACPNSALKMTNNYKLSEIGDLLKDAIYKKFNRSLVLRSVDTGSCNACMSELSATQNTYYDLSRFGISFAASPRHADGIVVTGPVTINMKEALLKTYEAMAEPKLVIAMGACGHDGGIFKDCYGVCEPLNKILPVDLVIPGCPPSPQAILYGLLKLVK